MFSVTSLPGGFAAPAWLPVLEQPLHLEQECLGEDRTSLVFENLMENSVKG